MNKIDKPLKLTLKHKWYDMIDSGVKLEEYRDITPFYHSRIDKYIDALNCGMKVYVTFYKAYTTNRPSMTFEIETIRQGTGNPAWGAVSGTTYYCIGLGKRIN
jgi:hypothetical protein